MQRGIQSGPLPILQFADGVSGECAEGEERVRSMRIGRQNHFAQGRLKTGQMNKTEARYADHLEGEKITGRVIWYAFEGMKLRLADNTFLSPDFAVLRSDGLLEMVDVKATTRKRQEDGTLLEKSYSMDDSRAKLKIAADRFPLVFSIVYQLKSGEWEKEEI